VRIATFNILSGRALSEQSADVEKYAAAVASLDADILGLQEVDRDQPRSGRADLTAVAAEAMGAVAHRFVPTLSGTPGRSWSAGRDDDPPGGPAYGIALLSRRPVTEWQVVRLPRLRIRAGEEPRVAVVATVDGASGRLRVATTHLSFVPWWNGQQLRALVRALGTSDGPTVLTGDLNMAPAPAARISGMRALASGPTFPNPEPRVQLDHLLADRPLRVVAGGAVRLPVSDHQALVADLG
jgi:endonuclease/exonuclease/phosphatase family metal-dependent hydrolase